jgi:hypothetical protein
VDLDAYAQHFKDGTVTSIRLVQERLAHWKTDPDLVGVRDAKSIATLPKAEQAEWRTLWADVDQLLEQVRSLTAETTTLTCTLTDRQREQVVELRLEAGKTYIFDMKSAGPDNHLKLYNAAGKLVAAHGAIAPNNLDARVVFTPKEAGVYRITATSFDVRGHGACTLTIASPSIRKGQ